MDRQPQLRPRPQPPEKPLPGDCCDSGCVDCILDQYGDALRSYERALAAWEKAQASDEAAAGAGLSGATEGSSDHSARPKSPEGVEQR